MYNRKLLTWIKIFPSFLFRLLLFLFPLTLHASFIESTMGTAVVNDATATYYNPAALTLLKNSQIIPLYSVSYFRTHFTGQALQSNTGFTQSGSSSTKAHYYLPSLYLGIPTAHKITAGLAIIYNSLGTNVEDNSILRYSQSSSSIRALDLVPSVGIKLNEMISLGAGINFSHTNFLLRPIIGFPSLNIPDSQSHNECSGNGVGGNFGLLLRPFQSTLIGFNYRSAITYNLSGKSIFESNPEVVSNHYFFDFWVPARSVLSVSHFVTSKLGFIGTIQRIQWNIFKNVNLHGVAAKIGPQPVILNATVPYHFHNTWLVTLGTQYWMTSKWIIRVAGSYNQSAGNNNFQITNGDSIILGASTGYEIWKNIIIDGSYAHAFFQNKNTHITTGRNVINGVNKGSLDAVSLKLTFNL